MMEKQLIDDFIARCKNYMDGMPESEVVKIKLWFNKFNENDFIDHVGPSIIKSDFFRIIRENRERHKHYIKLMEFVFGFNTDFITAIKRSKLKVSEYLNKVGNNSIKKINTDYKHWIKEVTRKDVLKRKQAIIRASQKFVL